MANDDGPRFRPVDPKVRFPELEERILAFWEEADVFRRSIAQREGAPEWVFYDGPPTANAKPHIGHARHAHVQGRLPALPHDDRATSSIGRRGGTATGSRSRSRWSGRSARRRSATSKRSGSGSSSSDAGESVRRYVHDWEELTRRIGFWIDMDDAYWTMDPSYVEAVWWSLKRLHERGLLVEADKVTAYCPRCGTALSDAEVALGYETTEDPSIHVRFPIIESPDGDLVGASLLVWTTTPWTLPSNAGAAVDPNAAYALAERDGERVVVAEARVADALGDGWTTRRRLLGRELLGVRYEPPYPNIESAHRVVAGEFVALDEGTGIVHMAPAFGPEDLEVGLAQGWAVFKPVGDDGRFTDLAPEFVRGQFVKDADAAIDRGPARSWSPPSSRTDRAHVSVLLALRHAAPLLRAHVLVREDHGGQGSAPRGERGSDVVPRITSNTAATATGWRTTWIGRFPASGIGARRCRSGAATRVTRRSSAPDAS